MLVQLSVANYRSIRDEQTIDFYAPMERDDLASNTVPFPEWGFRVLRSVGFYGANGAGKSTLFEALMQIMKVLQWENCKPDGGIPFYTPYRLTKKTTSQPSSFSLEFILPVEEMAPFRRFRYEVSFDASKICQEKLFAYGKKGNESLLFSRSKRDTCQTMTFGRQLRGGRKKIPFFQNQAYLAAAWKAPDSPKMLRTVAAYLCGGVPLPGAPQFGNVKKEKIASVLLPHADFGITKTIVKKARLNMNRIATLQKELSQEDFEALLSVMSTRPPNEYSFEHNDESGESGTIKLEEESDGTQVLFRILPDMLEIFDKGLTNLRDEIDSHLHPYLIELIIKLYNDPEINVNNAQLLYSTHNIGLLSERFLRKDQIWFVEKPCGASKFFSLQDFDDHKVTPTSPFALWYMDGRFGGVPRINYDSFVQALKRLAKEGDRDA